MNQKTKKIVFNRKSLLKLELFESALARAFRKNQEKVGRFDQKSNFYTP